MQDVFLFLVAPVFLIILYLIDRVIAAAGNCWHKWDNWIVWQTEDAYCQGRRCSKCGQQQVQQTMKVKNGHTNR